MLLDYVVILAWMAFLGLLSFLTYVVTGSLPDTLEPFGPLGSQVLYFFLLTFVVGVYLYRCESGPHHATWGKRRLAVAGIDGAAPSRRRILVRTVVKLLPWEAAHFFVWQMMWTFYQHGYDAAPPAWVSGAAGFSCRGIGLHRHGGVHGPRTARSRGRDGGGLTAPSRNLISEQWDAMSGIRGDLGWRSPRARARRVR